MMDRVEAVSRWMGLERPTINTLIERSGVSTTCGYRVAQGVVRPNPRTVKRLQAAAESRREELLEELGLIYVILGE
ncbi:UNVERIFIED_ORG: hypothetical protein BDU10_3107 [Burkholderia sp. CF145]